MKDYTIRKIAALAALAFSCLWGGLRGQGLQLSGRVADQQTGDAMPYANVALLRPADSVFVRGATTDADGRFAIADVDTGRYLLRATFVGYHPHTEPLRVLAGMAGIDIALRRGATLEAVEVSAERPLFTMDGEKHLYNAKDDPSVQTGTLSDALQNAPGVEVDAEGNITLRGVGSVEIWLNGRPSHLGEETLKQYIRQVPANSIERIEVITNPSARYSTTGGVINIVSNQSLTRNELLCLGVQGSTMPAVSPWLSYVWANEKVDVNLYLGAGIMGHRSYADGTATLYDPATGDTSRHQSHRDSTRSDNLGGYAGLNLNWNISSRTSLATYAGLYPYWGKSRSTVDLDYMEYLPPQDLGYRYTNRNDDGLFWGGYAGAWLEHRIDTTGQKLSLSLNGNTSNNGGTNYSSFAYHNPALGTLRRQTWDMTRNRSVGLTLDYTRPLGSGWEAEAGMSTSYGSGSVGRRLDTLGAAGYATVALRSWDGHEHGTDLAAYATVQKRWGGLTAKLGLRGEWGWMGSTWSYADGSGTSTADTFFFAPVPSIHLSYQTQAFTSYSLSYTRRYGNAGQSQLNPFARYDDYSYSTGNPGLALLSYTHNLEAAWNKYVAGFGSVNVGAYCRANTDEIGTMTAAGYAPAYFPPTQLVYRTWPDNIGSSHTEGLEANITYRPTAMLNVRLNASAFNYGYDYNGDRHSRLSWEARLNVWAKLWGWLEVFANAHYSSPRLGLYSLSVANKGVSLGLSSDFFDRRLSVYLNANDLFGTTRWGDNTTAPQYRTTGSQRYDSRFVSLGITWRIGKMELEGKAREGAAGGSAPQGMQ